VRYGRVIANLGVTAACLLLIALEIMGPGTSGPGAHPVDTFSHLDVRVDDTGPHVSQPQVPAGQVEVTVVDARSNQRAPLSVRSQPAALDLHAGTQLTTIRVLQTSTLHAFAGDDPLNGAAVVTVVPPSLAPSREASNRVTLAVEKTGISARYRDARFEEPVDGRSVPAASDDTPWTRVAPGRVAIVIQNREGASLSCTYDDGSAMSIAPGKTRSAPATLTTGVHKLLCGSWRFDLRTT